MGEFTKGMKGTISFRVEQGHLASEMSSGEVRVFATPMLVAGMEMAAVSAVQSAMGMDLTSVGTAVDIQHLAATPPGMKVTFEAVLVDVSANDRELVFDVKAWDEVGPIGMGTHKRVVVNREKFEQKAMSKQVKLPE